MRGSARGEGDAPVGSVDVGAGAGTAATSSSAGTSVLPSLTIFSSRSSSVLAGSSSSSAGYSYVCSAPSVKLTSSSEKTVTLRGGIGRGRGVLVRAYSYSGLPSILRAE